jgi:hypothetical protein
MALPLFSEMTIPQKINRHVFLMTPSRRKPDVPFFIRSGDSADLAIIPDAKWKPRKLWRESNGGLFDSLQKSTRKKNPYPLRQGNGNHDPCGTGVFGFCKRAIGGLIALLQNSSFILKKRRFRRYFFGQ